MYNQFKMNMLLRIAKAFSLVILQLEWLLKFSQANLKSFPKEGIRQQLWAFRKGFYLETINLCEITPRNVHEYISDKAYLKLHPINSEYSKMIDNKFFLPFLLKEYPDIVPKYYYLIDKGRLIKMDPELPDDKGPLQLCKETLRLAIKPSSSTMGTGFYRLEWKDERFYLNNKPVEIQEFNSIIQSLDNYLVTEYVNQNKYAAEINPSSVNTVRLICLRHSSSNKFFIPISFHRFGIEGKFVDNMGADGGGIVSYIDIQTGQIRNINIIKENGKLKKVIGDIKHPNSNKQITGIVIPNWAEMTNKVLTFLNNLSFLKYVGLDIVITEDGFKILEINSLPTLMGVQFEEGVFKDDKVKRFFQELK